MAVDSALAGFFGGLLGGIVSAIIAELVLHRVRHRLNRAQERTDAVANLEMAIGHVEDEWQQTGGRPTARQAEERQNRLQELRDLLNSSRVVLGKTLNGQLSVQNTKMAEAAQQGKPVDVRSAARGALDLLDRSNPQRVLRWPWVRRD